MAVLTSERIVAESLNPTTAKIIREIYGHVPADLACGLERLLADGPVTAKDRQPLWDERDVVLITYADQIRQAGASPLAALRDFLVSHQIDQLVRCLHLLPFCPYSSDDGFAVIDYAAVDSDVGNWDDIGELDRRFDLMFDLVLNHTSQQHRWFRGFLEDNPAYADFYIAQDPGLDLSAVVRPRSLPLLSEFPSPAGTRHVWTTFSPDQVDLNYANPRVMLAMIETLVDYARRGARIIRLDAIAYLWKEVGTPCIHLPQTHASVRLFRDVLDRVAPGTLILTETNVPHAENVSYFGNGHDEAHMVYQFSLPPLLLDAIHSGDTSILRDWISGLHPPSPETTFFNFTASHDGIGVRPLEGLVPAERLRRLVEVVGEHGGRVSTRRQADGTDSPYELNISYLDAVADRNRVPVAEHARRFLATQAIMLAMRGIPGIYFHSLVGTPNDLRGLEASGQNRRINRRKYDREELESAIAEPGSLQRTVMEGYLRMLAVRRLQPALHPSVPQQVLDLPGDGLLGLRRGPAGDHCLVTLANLTATERTVDPSVAGFGSPLDELAGEQLSSAAPIGLAPYQVRWLTHGR